jgi:hypothetical protein
VTSYTLAAEEQFGEPIGGVLIEGLAKGARKVEKAELSEYNGYRIQQSPFCYVYEHPTTGEYSFAWKRGWRKRPTWETLGVKGVVEQMGEAEARKILHPVLPIHPDAQRLRRWKTQTQIKEQRVMDNVEMVQTAERMGKDEADYYFPMNYDHCKRYWGHPCPYMEICFNEQVRADVLSSGLFQRRVPHHEQECLQPYEKPVEETEVEL